MWCRLVIEENTVYEIDDECAVRRQARRGGGTKGRSQPGQKGGQRKGRSGRAVAEGPQ